MKLRFQNGASISKWSFYFEIELRFRNGVSISKLSFDFEMELRFQKWASISKSSFDFHTEMELRFQNLRTSETEFKCALVIYLVIRSERVKKQFFSKKIAHLYLFFLEKIDVFWKKFIIFLWQFSMTEFYENAQKGLKSKGCKNKN